MFSKSCSRGSEVTGNNPEVDTQYWEESVVKDQAAGKGGPHYDTSKNGMITEINKPNDIFVSTLLDP